MMVVRLLLPWRPWGSSHKGTCANQRVGLLWPFFRGRERLAERRWAPSVRGGGRVAGAMVPGGGALWAARLARLLVRCCG